MSELQDHKIKRSEKVSLALLFLFALLLLQCSKKEEPEAVDVPAKPDYEGELVWSDEFNTDSLDLSKWNYETGTGVNGDWGTGQLDVATDREENVKIESGVTGADKGCLVITTRKEKFIGRNYTSGRINTKNKASWGPGHRIVVRAWPQGVQFKGQGFAFWMMPDELPSGESHLMWPQGGEVDVMEYVGSIPNANLASVHYAWSWENNQYQDWNHNHQGGYYSYESEEVPVSKPTYGNYPPDENDPYAGSFGFHTYGLDWYEDRMEFFVDDHIYHIHYFEDGHISADDGEIKSRVDVTADGRIYKSEFSHHFEEWKPFEHKFFVILSAGVGGADRTYGGAIVPEAEFPCPVYIDWVRVYKLKNND
ncbi:MAG TPA: hypothetical protein DDW81_03480 [Cryomorphaceae bacterium]|nr:hypothetical protein [Cryomorphaceae bacterium]HCQ16419.1 hypothetical protein [Cryomorphaceae bacterium]|tara:strand:+ start:2053 stop:3147 length:1095 start_codon:yes stop_codon:yes gene_type:complete